MLIMRMTSPPKLVKERRPKRLKKWSRNGAGISPTLFEKENFDELPEPKAWDHAIELIPNASANLDCKVYPLNRNKQAELDKF